MSNIVVSGLTTNRLQSLSSIINNMIYNKSGVNMSDSAAQNSSLATLQAVANNNKIDTSYSNHINSLQETIDSLGKQSNSVSSKIAEMTALKNSYSKTATSLDSFINNIKNSSSNSIYDFSNTNTEAIDVDLLTSNITSQRIEYNVLQVATATIATSNELRGVSVDKNTKLVDLFSGKYTGTEVVSTRTDIKGSTTMEQLGVTTGSFEIGGHIISVNSTDTVNSVIEKFNLAGYEAGFDAENKFYISSETESLAIRNQNTNFGEIMGLTVSKGTFSINGYDINITDSTTVQDILNTINYDEKFGVGASLDGNKIQLVANKTGDVLIEVAKGSSNFTNAIGFTTGGMMRKDNLTVGTEGRAQSITGVADVTGDMTFSGGNFSITNTINGVESRVEITVDEADTLESIIEKINESELDIKAEIEDGKLKIEQNQFGSDRTLKVEAGLSDFTEKVGLTDATASTGILSPGLDADYFTHLDGTNTITDAAAANTITEGSFKINNKTIQLAAGSVNDAIDQINLYSEETGVLAELVDDKVILRNRLTGTETLFVEGGTSNFGSVTGLTTLSTASAVSSIGTAGSASTMTGAESITTDTRVSASAIKINGSIVNIAEGNIVSAIDNINAAAQYTSVYASLESGHLVFTEARNGALSISVEDLSGNFGAITGIIGYTVVAGEEEQYGATRTKITTSRNVTNSMQISDSTLNINGTSINVSGTIHNAIETINANSVTTGVEAFINTDNKLTFRAVEFGETTISVQITDGDIGRVVGMGTYSTATGSNSQVDKIFASVTGGVTGLDEYSQILNGSTLKISTKDFETGAISSTNINIDGAITVGELMNRINAQAGSTKVVSRLNDFGQLELHATDSSVRTIGIEIGGSGDLGRVTGLGNYTIMGATSDGNVHDQTFSSITGVNNVNGSMQITDTSFTLSYVNDAGVNVSKTYEFINTADHIFTLQEVMNKVNTGTYDGSGVDNDWYIRADIIDGKFVFTSRAVGPFDLSITINDNADGTKGDFGRVIGMATSSAMAFNPTQNRKDAAYIIGGTDTLKLDDEIMGTNTITIWMTRENSATGIDTQTGTGELASRAATITINPNGTENMTVGQLINLINAQASTTKVKASLENGKFKLTQIDDLNADDASKYNTVGGANTAGEGDTIRYTITGTGDLAYVTGFGSYTTANQAGTGAMSNQKYTVLQGSTTVTGNETLSEGSFVLTGVTHDNKNETVTININRGETLNSVLNKITNAGVGITAEIKGGKVTITTNNYTDLGISTTGDADFLRTAGLGQFTIAGNTHTSGTAKDLGTHTHAVTKSTAILDGRAANGTLKINGVDITVIGKTAEEILVNINNATNAAGEKVARAELNTSTGLLTIQLNEAGVTAADGIKATGDTARVLGLADYTTAAGTYSSASGTDKGSHTHLVTTSTIDSSKRSSAKIENGSITIDGWTYDCSGKTTDQVLAAIQGSGKAIAQIDGSTLRIQVNKNNSTAADISATGDAKRALGLDAYTISAGTSVSASGTDGGTHTHGVVTTSLVSTPGNKIGSGSITIAGHTKDVSGMTIADTVTWINSTGAAHAQVQGTNLVIQGVATGNLSVSATGDAARVFGLSSYSVGSGTYTAGTYMNHWHYTYDVWTEKIDDWDLSLDYQGYDTPYATSHLQYGTSYEYRSQDKVWGSGSWGWKKEDSCIYTSGAVDGEYKNINVYTSTETNTYSSIHKYHTSWETNWYSSVTKSLWTTWTDYTHAIKTYWTSTISGYGVRTDTTWCSSISGYGTTDVPIYDSSINGVHSYFSSWTEPSWAHWYSCETNWHSGSSPSSWSSEGSSFYTRTCAMGITTWTNNFGKVCSSTQYSVSQGTSYYTCWYTSWSTSSWCNVTTHPCSSIACYSTQYSCTSRSTCWVTYQAYSNKKTTATYWTTWGIFNPVTTRTDWSSWITGYNYRPDVHSKITGYETSSWTQQTLHTTSTEWATWSIRTNWYSGSYDKLLTQSVWVSRDTGYNSNHAINNTITDPSDRVRNARAYARIWYYEKYWTKDSSKSYDTDKKDGWYSRPGFAYSNNATTQYRNVQYSLVVDSTTSGSISAGSNNYKDGMYGLTRSGTITVSSSRYGVLGTVSYNFDSGSTLAGVMQAVGNISRACEDGATHKVGTLGASGGSTDGYLGKITLSDTGNLLTLSGLGSGTSGAARTTASTNTDYNGITAGTASLTGSVNLANVKSSAIAGQVGGTLNVYIGGVLAGTVTYTAGESSETIVQRIHDAVMNVTYTSNKAMSTPFTDGWGAEDDEENATDKDSPWQRNSVVRSERTNVASLNASNQITYKAYLAATISGNKVVLSADAYGSNQTVTISDTGNWTQLVGLNSGSWSSTRSNTTNLDYDGIVRGQAKATASVNLNGVNDLVGQTAGTITVKVGSYTAGTVTYTANTSVDEIINAIDAMKYEFNTGKYISTPFTDAQAANDDNQYNTGNLENNGEHGTSGAGTTQASHIVGNQTSGGEIYYTSQLQCYRNASGQIEITSDVYGQNMGITLTDTGNFTKLVGFHGNTWANTRTNTSNTDYNGIQRGQARLTSGVAGLSLNSVRPFQTSTDGKSNVSADRKFDIYVAGSKVGQVNYNSTTSIENIIQQIEAMQYDVATGKYVTSTTFSNGMAVDDDNNFNTGVLEGTHEKTESQAIAEGYTIIRTAAELKSMVAGGKYILMGNIDMSNETNARILSTFSGELNGNGYTIFGVKGTSVFGTLSGATVKNLNIVGTTTSSGLLADTAQSNTKIENVHVSGSVTASSANAGGLVGTLTGSTVKNTTAQVNVTNSYTSAANTGGLVGSATGSSTIEASYAAGTVKGSTNGSSNVGGIAGSAASSTIKTSAFEGSIYGKGNSGAIAGKNTSSTLTNNKAVVEGQTNITAVGNGSAGSGNNVYWETNDQVNSADYGVRQSSYVDGSGQIHYTAQLQAYLTADGRLEITSDIYSTSAQRIEIKNDTGSAVKLLGLADSANTTTLAGTLTNGDEGIYTYTGGRTPGLNEALDLTFVGGAGQKFTVTIGDGSRTDTATTMDLTTITYDVQVEEGDTVRQILDKIVTQGKASIAAAYVLHRSQVVGNAPNYTDYDVRPEDVYMEAYVENERIVIKMDGKYGERIQFTNDSSKFVERTGLSTTTHSYAENDTKFGQTTGYDRITGTVNTITKDLVMANLTSQTFTITGGNGTYNVNIQNGWSIDEIIRQISIQTDGHYRAGIYNDDIYEANHQRSKNDYEYVGDYSGNTHGYNATTHRYEEAFGYGGATSQYTTTGNSRIKGSFFIESTDQTFTDTNVTDTDFTRRMGLVAHNDVEGANEETFKGDHGLFTYKTDAISGLRPNTIISGIKDGQLTFTLHSLDETGQMGSIEYRPDTTYTIDVAYNDTVTSILNKMKQAVYKTEDETLEHGDATESNRIDRLNFYVDYNSSTDSGQIVLEMIGNYADSITFDADTSGIMEALGLDKLSHTYNAEYTVTDISCGKSMVTGSVGSLHESKIFANMRGGSMVISAGDVSTTINVANTDRIKDVINKINEAGTFEAGLDASGHMYIKTNGQNSNAITITGDSEFAALVGLKSGSWTYTTENENGHKDFTKITGSVYGLQADQKFNNMTTGSFTISAAGLTSVTVNVAKSVTTISDVIAQINASADFSAELDEAGRLVVSTKKSVGSSIVIDEGTTNYTKVVGLTSGTLGGNAAFASGRADVFSELRGRTTGLDATSKVSAGDFIVSVKQNGETVSQTFTLTGTESLSDVAAMISNSNLGISAIFNAADNSMSLKAKTAGEIEISLKDGTSNFAEMTGFTQNGAQSRAATIGALSTLSSTNTAQSAQLLGFTAGTFDIELVNPDGTVSDKATVHIAKNDTVDSIISKINSTNLGLTAGIDASGKLVIQRNACDTAGGIRVVKGSSDFTNKIGLTTGGQQLADISEAGTDATRTVLKSNAISAPSAAASLGSLGITDGTFQINGVSVSVKSSDTITALLSKINATFSSEVASGVYAEFTGGRIVLTGNSQIGGGIINVESGTSNIADVLGFTNVSALAAGAQANGTNAIYTINGQRYESESNIISLDESAHIVNTDSTDEVIRLTIKQTGSGVVDVGKKSLTDAANKLAAFVNSFNTMTTLSASSTLKNDAEFAALFGSLMSALTDKVGSYSQVGKELTSMGITIYSTKDASGTEKISIAFNKDKFINSYLKNPQKVLDVLIGNDSRPIDSTKAGSMTRLANTLSKANTYFTQSINSLNTQAQNLALQIAQNTAELNNITATLALGGADTSFDDMSDYLAQLQAQYDSVNSLIKKLKTNYTQSVTRLALN